MLSLNVLRTNGQTSLRFALAPVTFILALGLFGTCFAVEPAVQLRGDAELFKRPVLSSSGRFVIAYRIEAGEDVSVIIDIEAAAVRDVFPLFNDAAQGVHYPLPGDLVLAERWGERAYFDVSSGAQVVVPGSVSSESWVFGNTVSSVDGRVTFNLGQESGCNANWCLSFVLFDLGQLGHPEQFWLRNPPFILADGVVIVGDGRESRTLFFSLFDPVPSWSDVVAHDSAAGEFTAAFRISGDSRLYGLFRDAPPSGDSGFVVDLATVDVSRVGLRESTSLGGLAGGPATPTSSVIGMPEPVARLHRIPSGTPSYMPSLWVDVDPTCGGTIWRWETPQQLTTLHFTPPTGCQWTGSISHVPPTISADGRRLLIPSSPEWFVLEFPEW